MHKPLSNSFFLAFIISCTFSQLLTAQDLDQLSQQLLEQKIQSTKLSSSAKALKGDTVQAPPKGIIADQIKNKAVTTAPAATATQIIKSETKPVAIVESAGGLEYYGYGIFKSMPASFEPTAVGPSIPGIYWARRRCSDLYLGRRGVPVSA